MTLSSDLDTPQQHRARYEALRAAARTHALPAPPQPFIPGAARVRHSETIPGGWYWSCRLTRGQTLRITNPTGRAQVALLLWNQADPSERFNAGDTVKVQWTARLTTGRVLLSDMGRVLAAITSDTAAGRHDALTGSSTPSTNLRRYGDGSFRNTRDNFYAAAAKLGLSRRDVPPCLTLFAGVRIEPDGSLSWQPGGNAGEYVDLRAELDLLAVMSCAPHPLDPSERYAPASATAMIWNDDAPEGPAPDDPCHATAEALRAYENNMAYLQGSCA